jgi:hypothetical protein
MASFRVKGAACRCRELARVKRVFKLASIQPANERAAEGPGWVIRVVLITDRPLPVYPDQQTSLDRPGWSGSCQQPMSVKLTADLKKKPRRYRDS